MSNYNIIIENKENTVVTEYKPQKKHAESYQSEAKLEESFINDLKAQGYEYLNIHQETDLENNLRTQLEKLNNYKFSDQEWLSFKHESIFNEKFGIEEKTKLIQEDFVQPLRCDNGCSKNIKLIDKTNIHKNFLQVINQYQVSKESGATHSNRYDVTILVNGLPLVHIELKRRGVPIKEAFNQIERYQRDSFGAGNGLFEFVQIFVISNGTNTKYYSNTTRFNHVKDFGKQKKSKTSNSFEFTSYWADSNNNNIYDLVDFTKTFFAKHTILNILTRYCVFTAEKMLLVMRPYQIVATERILNQIEISNNYKKYGTVESGGYIWHTTGSGKTLTSFKTAQLASKLDYISKVLFVVDRKDLDYQTMKEYDRFEKGAANSNTSTAILKKQLENKTSKIIITTIQKLSCFIKANSHHKIFLEHVVIIFDECHRSQFGDMHRAIIKNFKNYHLFGFTGTPIFAENASKTFFTTESTFGKRLHTYTIVNAINDKNVLPFRVDYIKTFDKEDYIDDKDVYDIDREGVFLAPGRIELVTKYIIDHFDQKTYRKGNSYTINASQNISHIATNKKSIEDIKCVKNVTGFNSILAVSSIEAAKLYYNEFKRQNSDLKITVIYSYGVNQEEVDGFIEDENSESAENLNKTDRDFLENSIADYNKMFGTSYSTDGDKFQNFYKDVSLRMKNKELDLLIVVNMFLTGFDATTLNTLWVDKNLKMHGLIQAFSRTNRILNSIKTFGNIICFRNLQKSTDKAIALFGDKDAKSIVLMRTFNDYYFGYNDDKQKFHPGYETKINELLQKYPLGKNILGEKSKRDFVILFGEILRLINLLNSFDEFNSDKKALSELELQDYMGHYHDIRDEFVKHNITKEDITKDIVFELELIKQIEINIDYILALVEKYHKSNCKDKDIYKEIQKAISSSTELRSKKELINNFIETLNNITDENGNIIENWEAFVNKEKEVSLSKIINEEKLKEDRVRNFIENAFHNGEVKTTGTDIDDFMPPISRFSKDIPQGFRQKKKAIIIEKLMKFFETFYGV